MMMLDVRVSLNTALLDLGLSKYLTAQDTRDTSTITKYNRTLVRLGNLLPLEPRSTIKLIGFLVPSIE